ncbi:uncharacterized protein LOC112552585 isoform X1 [Pogonomyrmex barbatus]|uniref:Uncharacterized protein LOC112552585 isoform X1 n=1 Tax=Pogonomyrmex barbatus TaxID=144034 RepID=A0A8N1S7I5_9HYME|nr:uncharacterized protein LOC112552585 isoform X1 [Pogonomyrmex barbatus]
MCFITFYKCLQLSINYTYWISLKKGSLTYVAAIFFFFFLVGQFGGTYHRDSSGSNVLRRDLPQERSDLALAGAARHNGNTHLHCHRNYSVGALKISRPKWLRA